MGMTPIAQKLQARLDRTRSLLKTAGIEEVSTDSAGKKETGATAEALQEGAVSGIVDANVVAEGETQPGGASNIMNSSPTEATETPIASTSTNEDQDAAAVLGAEKGEVVATDLPAIEKSANALIEYGKKLIADFDEGGAEKGGIEKEASDLSADQLLRKLADEGDQIAQYMLDYQASFALGMQKKANDIAAMVGEDASPEDVAQAEEMLNQTAAEDPAAILTDANEGELEGMNDEELMAQMEGLGADVESEAQEAVLDLADVLLEAYPELDEPRAIQIAQEEVADALATMAAGQDIGATDESGEYIVPDEEAAEAVDAMAKTASAHPYRDAICAHLNARIGLDPSAFAERLGF
jgi:hypothetical protein